MSRLYQIYEDDLAELERVLPRLADRLTCGTGPNGKSLVDNRTRTQIRRVQEILKNVRWNYGPPDEVGIVPAEGGG